MRSVGFFVAVFAFVAGTLAQGVTPTPTPEKSSDPQLIDTSIHSAIMNEDRRVIIHLPRKYSQDAGKKYPVMFVLDGTSQDQHTADKIAVLADAGIIPAVIVVGLPNTRGNRERDQTPSFMRRNVDDPNSPFGGADKFLGFIEKELIPYIDAGYRTSGYRLMTGNSRGGLFVLYTLLERPELFSARFCYSTPVWRFNNLMIDKIVEFLRKPGKGAGFLFMAVGDKETDQITGGFTKMSNALIKHAKNKLVWVGDRTPWADHQDNVQIATSKGLAERGKYLNRQKDTQVGGWSR